jgi:hypothetical protein
MQEWRHEATHGTHLNPAAKLSKEWGPLPSFGNEMHCDYSSPALSDCYFLNAPAGLGVG